MEGVVEGSVWGIGILVDMLGKVFLLKEECEGKVSRMIRGKDEEGIFGDEIEVDGEGCGGFLRGDNEVG